LYLYHVMIHGTVWWCWSKWVSNPWPKAH